MPSKIQSPAGSPGTSPERRGPGGLPEMPQRVVNRLLLLVLLGLLGMPPAPPPLGAIQPLWGEASHLQRLKSYAAAVEVYERIAGLTPQDPAPLLAIGDIYRAQHRWPLAEDAFNRALVRAGDSTHALAGLATARWEQGDRSRAIWLWEAALAAPSTSPPEPGSYLSSLRVRLALAYLDTDRPVDAEAMLQQELASADNPAAHLLLAMMRAAEDTNSARRELAAIPDDAPPAQVDARDYLLAAIEQAEAAGSAAGAAKSLGLAFVQIEEWQLARLALERALKLEPNDAQAMAFLGHTQAQLGRPAFSHLTTAIKAQPDWPLGHYLLGLYFLKQGVYAPAAEELQAALRLDPGNAQAQVDLAKAYVGLGDYTAAEESLLAAVKASPDELAFHLALVGFYADHIFGATERGVAAAGTAVELAPNNAQARDMLGWMYFLAGDPAQARSHLEHALRLEPELASAHYHLGLLHKSMGAEEGAESAFARAVDLDTDGFYRDRAQTALREMRRDTQ